MTKKLFLFYFQDVIKMQLNKLKKLIGTFRNNDDNIMILFIICASAVVIIGIFPFLRIGLLIICFCVVGIISIFLYETLNYTEEL